MVLTTLKSVGLKKLLRLFLVLWRHIREIGLVHIREGRLQIFRVLGVLKLHFFVIHFTQLVLIRLLSVLPLLKYGVAHIVHVAWRNEIVLRCIGSTVTTTLNGRIQIMAIVNRQSVTPHGPAGTKGGELLG